MVAPKVAGVDIHLEWELKTNQEWNMKAFLGLLMIC